MANPFPSTTSTPGRGIVELVHHPPSSSSLRTVSYQYPLKLIAPASHTASDDVQIQTVYLLTYGGGLVAGDTIDASISLDTGTRLIMLTQGSTKIFISPSKEVVSRQRLTIDVAPGAALCYLPDPVQPFEGSCFAQTQIYTIARRLDEKQRAQSGSVCALDWVSEGRTARGEKWDFLGYSSKNELWLADEQRSLLLRDNIRLDDALGRVTGQAAHSSDSLFGSRMDDLGVFGTLVLHGPLFAELGKFLMDEFKLLPRIGGGKWDTATSEEERLDDVEAERAARHRRESAEGILWTVSFLRGCTVVKFGARKVESGKRWLMGMLEAEGSVVRHFGERALLCLR